MLDAGIGAYGATPKNTNDFSDITASATPAAQRQAKAQVREKNKHEWTCEFEFAGNVKIVAGATFTVTGCGVYDGKYYIDECQHKKAGGGAYTVSGKAHRILEGY